LFPQLALLKKKK